MMAVVALSPPQKKKTRPCLPQNSLHPSPYSPLSRCDCALRLAQRPLPSLATVSVDGLLLIAFPLRSSPYTPAGDRTSGT